MAADYTLYYWDENGKKQTGYVYDQKTYTDAAGMNRVSIGSIVPTNDGLYKMTENGGVKVTPGEAKELLGNADLPGRAPNHYIEDIYAARVEADWRALEAAYTAQINAFNAAETRLPQQYQAARNTAASQSETQKANFNEYAAAHGLNSGTGGQVALAMSSQLQSTLSGLNQGEAAARATLELQRAQLTAAYQNDIAGAIADGNFRKAQALYEQYQTEQANLMKRLTT